MAIRLVVTFKAKAGQGAQMAAAFAPAAEIVHKEKGCEQYEMFQGCDDPDKLVLLERWSSPEDLDVHGEAMRARGPSLMTAFRDDSAPPAVERFEV
jgi:quinol monooxygenase YgiN